MRVRAESATGDYQFGLSDAQFLVNSPQAVSQAIHSALLLFFGEYFLNLQLGVPWETKVAGFNTSYDTVIQEAIRGVQGVVSILSYSSSLNRATRALTVNCRVQSLYGVAVAATSIPVPAGIGFGLGPFGNYAFGG